MTEYTFVQHLAKLLKEEGFLVKKEIGVGYGIADLVIIKKSKFDLKRCTLRSNYKQFSPLLKTNYFKLLKHIPDLDSGDEPIDIDLLVEKTHISRSLLKYDLLKSLEEKKYIKKEGGKYYFKVNGWAPLAKEIIAIEAKLKDWKRGFIQANRYRTFADKVYLALPEENIRLVDKELLKKHHVGLISFNVKTAQKRVIIKSSKEEPLNEFKRNFASEYFWNRNILKELATT